MISNIREKRKEKAMDNLRDVILSLSITEKEKIKLLDAIKDLFLSCGKEQTNEM